ncbi:MAG: glycosyltransferase family 4 protein, partial [Gaiellales bacterium]
MDGSLLDQQAAVVGFLVAFLLAVLLTPVVSQAAWRAGIVDTPTEERRLHARPTPLLGGLAIFAAIAIPAAALGNDHGFWGIIAGAALMAMLGALDDIHPLHPAVKLGGMAAIASIPAFLGITIDHITLPFLGVFDLGWWQYPVTIIWIVAIANIVNFIDGMDGLAAGFCGIAAL